MNNKLSILTLASLSVAPGALAEGLERSTFSAGYLYEQGSYIQGAFGYVNPNLPVTAGPTSPNSVAESFTVQNLSFKTDLSDKFALGFHATNGSNGVAIDYAGAGLGPIPPSAHVFATELQVLGKYQLTDRFSLFGGAKHVTASGDINLDGTNQYEMSAGSGTGIILGAAYEIPDIALRAALSYESAIDLSLPTTINTVDAGFTTAGIGDAVQLEFQTGIAENTLIYGQLRYSMWADNQVLIPVAGQVSTFEDGLSYELGIARRFSESFAASLSAAHDPGDGTDASALAPFGAKTGVTLGGRYTLENGVNIGLGVSYTIYGDATIAAPFDAYSFSNGSVLSAGITISKNF